MMEIIKKFIKYISRIALGLVTAYIGLVTYIAFNLDVLHNYNKEDHYCLIPSFGFCLLLLAISLAIFYLLWCKTKEW